MLSGSVMLKGVSALMCLIDWCVIKGWLGQLGNIKINTKKYYQVWSMMLGIQILLNLLRVNPYVKVILIALLVYIFACIGHNINRMQRVLGTIIFIFFSIGVEGAAMSVGSLFYQFDRPENIVWTEDCKIFFVILSRLFMVLGYLLIKHFKLWVRIWQKEVGYIFILIGTNILMLFFTFENTANISAHKSYSRNLFIIILLISIANIILFILMIKFNQTKEIEIQLHHYEERMDQQYDYYVKLEEEHHKIRVLYHDMNNHLACLKGLVNDQQGLKNYLQELEDEVKMETVRYQTGNPMIDTILRGKSALCREYQIDLKVKLDLKNTKFMEDKDVCCILANALDNAIEACQVMTTAHIKPSIILEGKQINNFIIIKISNTKDKPIKELKGRITTDKTDSFAHGLGLMSIRRSVEKYNGEMTINYTKELFEVKILIPLSETFDK